MTEKKDKREINANKPVTEEDPYNEPMYVDKNYPEMSDLDDPEDLHVAYGEDSRANRLDSLSFEDHQQEFAHQPDKGEKKDK